MQDLIEVILLLVEPIVVCVVIVPELEMLVVIKIVSVHPIDRVLLVLDVVFRENEREVNVRDSLVGDLLKNWSVVTELAMVDHFVGARQVVVICYHRTIKLKVVNYF